MGRRRLPEEAFGYYVALGPGRSYRQVGEHFGVAEKTVARTALKDDWQGRLSKLFQDARDNADAEAATTLERMQTQHVQRMADMQTAVRDVLTPTRLKAVFATLFKLAVQGENITAARLLIERTLGKPRNEALAAFAVDVPDGLETTSDVRKAANALLGGLARGSLAPEDAQKAATVIEAARRSIETENLESRIAQLEAEQERKRKR